MRTTRYLNETDCLKQESVPLLSALTQPRGYPDLKLGLLNCEKDNVLCTAWGAAIPSVYHFIFPRKPSASSSDPQPKSPLRIIPLNVTSATVEDVTSIPRASKSRYADYAEEQGLLHPVDGWIVRLGLLHPLGYFLWALGSTPSWLFMIGLSFFSRQFMSRRMAGRPDIYGNRPAGAAPGAAPGAGSGAGTGARVGGGTPARPGSAGAAAVHAARSGGKKRR